MTIQQSSKVFTTGSSLMAHSIQIALQSAGIPSTLTRAANGGMDVKVPAEHSSHARQLLTAEPHYGEILFIPGCACRMLS